MSTYHLERSERLKRSWSIYRLERSESLKRSWSTYNPEQSERLKRSRSTNQLERSERLERSWSTYHFEESNRLNHRILVFFSKTTFFQRLFSSFSFSKTAKRVFDNRRTCENWKLKKLLSVMLILFFVESRVESMLAMIIFACQLTDFFYFSPRSRKSVSLKIF